MSGPPPPPPPPGPPPPPAMAPPALSKSEQHGRSALLTDITKGTKLKSAKHLMNDRSGLPSSAGGTQGKGGGMGGAGNRPVIPSGCENGRISSGRSTTAMKAELICYPVPAPRCCNVGYSNSFSAIPTKSPPMKPALPNHSGAIQHSRSLREKPSGPPPPPPSSSPSSSSSSFLNGRTHPTGASNGTGTVSGGVRNPPPGLGDLFSGGVPKLKGSGSGTVSGRSRVSDRISNGSLDNFPPPPPPPSTKPTMDYTDNDNGTVGRSSGNRMSVLPPPPSPSQLSSRPLPNVPPPPPSSSRSSVPGNPPPPPVRTTPASKVNNNHENGPVQGPGYGTNRNRALPPVPALPPKPPERKESAPPPPPFEVPPPPPQRGPPSLPGTNRPGGKVNTAPVCPAPSSGPPRANHVPPPPGRPPAVSRSNSSAMHASSDFEKNFHFRSELPAPDPFFQSAKTYPSQHPNKKASTNPNRRPVPPPPPPGSSY